MLNVECSLKNKKAVRNEFRTVFFNIGFKKFTRKQSLIIEY